MMFNIGDTVTIPSSFAHARTIPLTVIESNSRHTLTGFPDGSEQWFDTNRLVKA